MGYYSDFNLKIVNHNDLTTEELKKLDESLQAILFIDNVREVIANGETKIFELKWYEYKEELIKLSKDNPTVKIDLTIWGEEREDVRKSYFYNGKNEEFNSDVIIQHHLTTLF